MTKEVNSGTSRKRHSQQYKTEALALFEYIEVDYNRTRRHSANGCISPETFEIQQAA